MTCSNQTRLARSVFSPPRTALLVALMSASIMLVSQATAAAASFGVRCGAYRVNAGGTPATIYRATVYERHTSCNKAVAIIKDFQKRGSDVVVHNAGGPLLATSWTLKSYPGWRCVVGAGGGACLHGRQEAQYVFDGTSSAHASIKRIYFWGAIGGRVVKPKVLSLTVDGTLEVSQVRWTRWGGSIAVGTGQAEYHGCSPSCGAAPPHYAAVTVNLSRIRTCSGRSYYSKVTLFLRSGKQLNASYLKRSWAPC